MAVEFEIKFRATPEQQAEVQNMLSGETRQYRMQTAYYDTPDGDLSALKYTLRRRMENEISVCTLKTPAKGLGRNEFEIECDSIETAIPQLCQMSALPELPELLAKGVIATCGAVFQRTAITVKRPDCTLEIALDRGILTGGGKELPLCEIEVELKSGTQEAAKNYAKMLQVAYGLTQEKLSKVQRARALARGEW